MKNKYKIGFISLGCPKALVDSERIMTQLRARGYILVSTYEEAALVVINTCGFIESAIEESLSTIKEAMQVNGKVIVTGCLGAKADLIKKHCPDILHISGPHAYEEVVSAVVTHLPPPSDPFVQLIPAQGLKLTPKHYAYLKISEGCNQKCTFCIIPTMRGKLQSTPMSQILYEAEKLKEAGVKELLVISQDTGAYGVDVKYSNIEYKGRVLSTKINTLLEELGKLGIWVRLHYIYPYPHIDEIIPLMRDGLILPYLDIPLQHASKKILKTMKRPANKDNTLERIYKWRKICPDLTIRSTFIVGFPGETEEDYSELLDFLQNAKLDRVGCFKYSKVEGAVANNLDSHVTQAVQEDRYDRFMRLQADISEEKLKDKQGKILTVLVDEVQDECIIARSKADAPEIDGLVYLPYKEGIVTGQMLDVKINDSDTYDLFADYLEN